MFEVKAVGTQLGLCPGVTTAVEQAKRFAEDHDRVYSLGTVAHNTTVIKELEKRGVIPHSAYHCPAGSPVVVTAHGTTPSMFETLRLNGCDVLDCTCPIVRKAQDTVDALARDGYDIVIFGDHEHQEVRGLVGWGRGAVKFIGLHKELFDRSQNIRVLGLRDKIGVVSQTTQPHEDYMDFVGSVAHFFGPTAKEIRAFNTICPIVTHRLQEAFNMAQDVDVLIVVGSKESANTQNLYRAGSQGAIAGGRSWAKCVMVDGADQVMETLRDWMTTLPNDNFLELMQKCTVGVTAGTSTPVEVVKAVIAILEGANNEG